MVGVAQRTDVDWQEVRRRWQAGETFGGLARVYGVSRQAIAKHHRKEGWTRTPDAEALAATLTAQRLREPRTPGDKRMIAAGRRNLDRAQRLLDIMAGGGTLSLAAQRLGMDRNALADWLKEDPDLKRQVEAARAERALTRIGQVDAAADRGDWRAAAWALERDPATREDFAQVEPARAAGGPAIALQVVVGDGAAALLRARIAGAEKVIVDAEGVPLACETQDEGEADGSPQE